jgi:nucleoside-diphosphate-sugar epimerase
VRNKDDPKNNFLKEMPETVGKGTINVFSAELQIDRSYDDAFSNALAVIHVAAVLSISDSQDPVTDMIEPSTRGTKNVLASVEKMGVLHYVHTSSVAAVASFKNIGRPFDERDWSGATLEDEKDSPIGPYRYAKTLGEQEVWKFSHGKSYTVSCICPTMVFGPCLCKSHSKASPFIFRQALYGNSFFNNAMSLVDVRNVAQAHVNAMEKHPEANGKRFIVDNDEDNTTANTCIRIAQKLFPHISWAISPMPDPPVAKAMWNNQQSKDILGMTYISDEQCIRDTVASMIKPGWVPTKPSTANIASRCKL